MVGAQIYVSMNLVPSKMIKGSEGLIYEERLKELNL